MANQAQTTWWTRRIDGIREQIEAGTYHVSAEDVAHAMMFGRPRWGKEPILLESLDHDDRLASQR